MYIPEAASRYSKETEPQLTSIRTRTLRPFSARALPSTKKRLRLTQRSPCVYYAAAIASAISAAASDPPGARPDPSARALPSTEA